MFCGLRHDFDCLRKKSSFAHSRLASSSATGEEATRRWTADDVPGPDYLAEGWIPASGSGMTTIDGAGMPEGEVGLFGCGDWVCILFVGFWVGDGRRFLDFDPVPIQAACRCPGVGGHLPPAIAMPPRTEYGLARQTGREQSPSFLVPSKYGPQATYAR